jgi:Nif-specific regulatory protein
MSAGPEAPAERAASWSPGSLIDGRYRLIRLLGEGGAAHVWLAEDSAAGGLVALKTLPLDRRIPADHLKTEFSRLSRIAHPNVVGVHEFGMAADGSPYFTMDFIDGLPLGDSVSAGDLSDVLPLLEGAAAGLEAIHSAQLIHGDVKPANILVLRGEQGAVRLVDLNLASAGASRSRAGGTPGFVAPEVLAGEPLTALSDLYGLGAAFYTALAGRAPHLAATVEGTLQAQMSQEASPEPLRASGVSDELIEILLRLLARDPAQRPRSVTELREMLASLRGRARRAASVAPVLAAGSWVGREKEISRVESRIARGGLPVIVTGRAGVGRSRFFRELALRAELAGGRAVVVSCRGRSDGGEEWMRRVSILADSREDSRAADLLRRFEGGTGGPRLLVLEDLQTASESDLEVARQLLVARTPPGTLVILSWEESAHSENKQFEDFSLVARGPWLEESPLLLHLPALPRRDSDAMVRSLLGGTSLEAVEEAVWKISGGAPAWVEGVVRALAERGAIYRDPDGWRVAPDADLSAPLPALERIHAGRLAFLSSDAREWLAALAALGGEAPTLLVRELAGGSEVVEDEVARNGLSALEDRGGEMWARLDPPSVGAIALRSLAAERLRDLYAAAAERLDAQPMRAAELWLLAGRADRALAALPSDADARLSAPLAWAREELRVRAHEKLGDLGFEPLLEAAVAAKRALKMHAAAGLFERAAELRGDSLDSAAALLEAAECARWLAEHERERVLLDRVEGLLDGAAPGAPGERTAELRSRLLSERSWLELGAGHMQRAEELARSALEAAPSGALAARFTAWNRLAGIHQQAGQLQNAQEAIDEAFRLARALGDDLALARISSNAAVVAGMRGDRAGEAQGLRESIALAERHGSFQLAALGRGNLIAHIARHGSVEELRSALRSTEEALRSSGAPEQLFFVLNEAARLEFRLGHLKRAHDLSARRFLGRSKDRESMNGWAWNRLGMIHALWDRFPSAAKMYRRAMRVWRKGVLGEASGYTLANVGELALEAGQLRRAERFFERAAREARRFPTTAAWVLRPRLYLALRTRNADGGRRAIEEGPSLSAVAGDPHSEGCILEALSIQAFLEGDVNRAVEQWREAERTYREKEYPLARAKCISTAGAALAGVPGLSGEQRTLALGWLEEARAFYERIGAKRLLLPLLSQLNRLHTDDQPNAGNAGAETFYEISQILNSILDFPDLLNKTLSLVCRRLSAERGLIVLVDAGSTELTPVARYGTFDEDGQADALQVSTSIVRRVAASGFSLRSDDAVVDPQLSSLKSVFDLSLRSVLCVALRLRDQVIGTIYLQNRTSRAAFTDSDIAFLESFSNLVAVAIENSRLHEALVRSNEDLVDENVSLRREMTERFLFTQLVGRSPEMGRTQALLDRFIKADADVLIQGETGTGKELVAKTIHYNSTRKDKPFLTVSCVALPETLIERELFGIDAHTATGVNAAAGVFERAEGGTVLLDEIGDMPLSMQSKLLRVLQEREFTRVGGKRSIRMNVRVISATNADLPDRVKADQFRADLYFRVAKLVVHLPPLRERRGDVPILARHFIKDYCERVGRSAPKVSPRLLAVLGKHSWPGNVRELQHYMERLLVMSDAPTLEPLFLPEDLSKGSSPSSAPPQILGIDPIGNSSLDEALAAVQRQLIEDALNRSGGNQSQAAKLLGLREATLRYRLRVLGMRG